MYEFKLFLFCVLIYLIQLPSAFFCQEEYTDEDDNQPLVDSFNTIEDGLKCGACSTNIIPDCGDPSSKNINTQNCDKNKASVCRTVEYFNRKENRMFFSRACVEEFDTSNNTPCSKARTDYFGNVRNCTVCNTDLCNINQGMTEQQSKAQQSFATQQPNKNQDNSSTALRSSFYVLIMIMFFNSYKTYI